MADTKKKFEVFNRTDGYISYSIPDLNVERLFAPGERKLLTYEELDKLSYTDGGAYLLKNCLLIKDADVVEELSINTEPEYFYTEEDIKTILTTGTYDQLSDCLTFAPTGVLDILKNMAIALPVNDIKKAQMISEKFGIDLMKMIENSKDEEVATAPIAKERKAAPVNTPKVPNTARKAEPISDKQ